MAKNLQPPQYIVVQAMTLPGLQKKVSDKMQLGYVPVGNPTPASTVTLKHSLKVGRPATVSGQWTQTMVLQPPQPHLTQAQIKQLHREQQSPLRRYRVLLFVTIGLAVFVICFASCLSAINNTL